MATPPRRRGSPFPPAGTLRPELWNYGLRNPWRWSFDRQTHDLYIADVGQNAYAAYLFLEEGSRLGGVRLFLRKLKEEGDHELIAAMTRRHLTAEEDLAKGPKFLSSSPVGRSTRITSAPMAASRVAA